MVQTLKYKANLCSFSLKVCTIFPFHHTHKTKSNMSKWNTFSTLNTIYNNNNFLWTGKNIADIAFSSIQILFLKIISIFFSLTINTLWFRSLLELKLNFVYSTSFYPLLSLSVPFIDVILCEVSETSPSDQHGGTQPDGPIKRAAHILQYTYKSWHILQYTYASVHL